MDMTKVLNKHENWTNEGCSFMLKKENSLTSGELLFLFMRP